MKVKKKYLLLIACLVWSIAGGNILAIGLGEYSPYVKVVNILMSAAVFAVFQIFVFGKLVKKHTKRIREYIEEHQYFFRFFDRKSFLIMAIMMSGGIWLRTSGVAPARFIAVFYSGLGLSLLLAGIMFGACFINELGRERGIS